MRSIKLELLKLKLKNNDKYTKVKIKKCLITIIVLTLILILLITKPLTKLKEIANYKLTHPKEVKLYTVYKESENTNTSSSKYIYPANGVVTSNYGYRTDPISGEYSFHTGVDISCYTHRDNILAVADGIVTFSGLQNDFGYCVEIKHEFENETIYSFYAHLSNISVSEGQTVTQGQVIGNEGGDPNTDPYPGYSTGHHLHFELRSASGYGNDINPNLT